MPTRLVPQPQADAGLLSDDTHEAAGDPESLGNLPPAETLRSGSADLRVGSLPLPSSRPTTPRLDGHLLSGDLWLFLTRERSADDVQGLPLVLALVMVGSFSPCATAVDRWVFGHVFRLVQPPFPVASGLHLMLLSAVFCNLGPWKYSLPMGSPGEIVP